VLKRRELCRYAIALSDIQQATQICDLMLGERPGMADPHYWAYHTSIVNSYARTFIEEKPFDCLRPLYGFVIVSPIFVRALVIVPTKPVHAARRATAIATTVSRSTYSTNAWPRSPASGRSRFRAPSGTYNASPAIIELSPIIQFPPFGISRETRNEGQTPNAPPLDRIEGDRMSERATLTYRQSG
jgi:hypothetical protein